MQIFIVTRECWDYEGSSATMLKAFTDRSVAEEMSNTLESARDLYKTEKKLSPALPRVRLPYTSVKDLKLINDWREECAGVQQFNEALKEKIICELVGDEFNHSETREYLESDPEYESIEITAIELV